MDSDFRPITKGDPNAWKRTLIIGGILLALGLLPVSAVSVYYSTRNITPVDLPVPSHPVTLHSGRFTINYPGFYEINYRARRTLPYDKLTCLLGIRDSVQPKCEGPQPKFATSWILRDSKGIVARGQSEHWKWNGSSADDEDVGIGSFRSVSGIEYTLDVTVKSDTSTLAAAHPRLVVEIHPMNTEGWVFPVLLTWLLAILFAPVGLWKTVSALIARRKSQK